MANKTKQNKLVLTHSLKKEINSLLEALNYSQKGLDLFHKFSLTLEQEIEKLKSNLYLAANQQEKERMENAIKLMEIIHSASTTYLGDDSLKELAAKISHVNFKSYFPRESPMINLIDKVRGYTYAKFASPYDEA